MICTYSFPGIFYSLSSLKHKQLFHNFNDCCNNRTNNCGIVQRGTHPVDEDIFWQTRVWIQDPAESVHHFSTVQLLNQLLQSSIWYINNVEKSNGFCGWFCNCTFFPLTNEGVQKQRQAVLLCWYFSTAAVRWRWNSSTRLIISSSDHKNLIIS